MSSLICVSNSVSSGGLGCGHVEGVRLVVRGRGKHASHGLWLPSQQIDHVLQVRLDVPHDADGELGLEFLHGNVQILLREGFGRMRHHVPLAAQYPYQVIVGQDVITRYEF